MATTFKFSDIQIILDAIAKKSHDSINTSPHGRFWLQSGNYGQDYTAFTTGNVPNVGLPIMDPTTPLQSNFFVILTNPNGLSDQGIPQMPAESGAYITDPGYSAELGAPVNGLSTMTGQQMIDAMTSWLTSGFQK